MANFPARGFTAEAGVTAYLARSAAALNDAASRLDAATFSRAVTAILAALQAGHPLLVCGNGGSAADAQHIAAELVGRFLRERRAYKVICLASDIATITAWANDYGYEGVFARQVEAYGEAGSVLLGLSTSGNSRNVVAAFQAAKAMGMTTIAMTGAGGGALADVADILLDAPSTETAIVQQIHLCLYHQLCAEIEEAMMASDGAVAPAA